MKMKITIWFCTLRNIAVPHPALHTESAVWILAICLVSPAEHRQHAREPLPPEQVLVLITEQNWGLGHRK